jgi:hypothetical protein
MKSVKITKYIILTGLTIFFLWVCPLFAEDDGDEVIDQIQAAESDILTRLNLARDNPWAEAERLGLDPEVLRAEVVPEEVAVQWDHGLCPLVCNDILNEVARTHCEDMVARDYFSSETLEGQGAEELVYAAGYSVQLLREHLAALGFEIFLDPQEAVKTLIDVLLVDALMQRFQDGEPTLLHEGVVEAGTALWGGELSIDNKRRQVYIIYILLARPEIPESAWFQCGYVYQDLNGNYAYDPGEGLEEIEPSYCYDNEQSLKLATGPQGVYCLQRPLDQWRLKICDNVWLDLWCPEVSESHKIVMRHDYMLSPYFYMLLRARCG